MGNDPISLTKRRDRSVVLLLSGLLLIWCAFTGIRIWTFGNLDHAEKSDCIIVLGAAAYGSKPSLVFEQRIKHAIRPFHEGNAPTIIFTGGRGDHAPYSESEVGAMSATSEGVPNAAILTETKSRTTHQNLVEAKALMDAAGLDSANIVSDPLHLKRASAMARDLGLIAVPSPTPTSRYRMLRVKLECLLREIYFCNYYALTGD